MILHWLLNSANSEFGMLVANFSRKKKKKQCRDYKENIFLLVKSGKYLDECLLQDSKSNTNLTPN